MPTGVARKYSQNNKASEGSLTAMVRACRPEPD
jgi:hypothetical protein